MSDPGSAASAARLDASVSLPAWRSDLARALLLALGLLLGMWVVVRPLPAHLAPYTVEAAFAGLLSLLVALAAWGVSRAWPGRDALLPERLLAALLFWLGLVVLGLLRSPHAGVGLPKAANAAVYVLLLVSACTLVRLHGSAALLLGRAVVAMGAVEVFFGAWLRWVQLPQDRALVAAGKLPLTGILQSQQGRARLESNEIFGTFDNPNSYAAFLLLALFVHLGLWCAASGRGVPPALGRAGLGPRPWRHVLIFALLGYGLYLSGSKGAWMAGLIGAWFLALPKLSSTPLRARLCKGLTVAGLLVLVLVLALGAAGCLGANLLPASLEVRYEYWRTAWRMIADQPILGIGLGGFGDAFSYYKTPLAGEVKEAHNDWLQLWAELGVLGPLAWGLLWYLILRPRTPRDAAADGSGTETAAHVPEPSGAGRLSGSLLAGGGLAFVLVFAFLDGLNGNALLALLDLLAGATLPENSLAGTLAGACAALSLPVLFAGVFLATQEPKAPTAEHYALPDQRFLWGLRAGLGAVLVHQLVDFDLQAPGVMAFCFLLGGVLVAQAALPASKGLAAQSNPLARVRWAGLPALLLLLVPAAVLVPLFSGQARQVAAELEEQSGEQNLRITQKSLGPEEVRAALAEAHGLRVRAVRQRESARAWAPFDGQAAFDLALAYLALRQAGVRTWTAGDRNGGPRQLKTLAQERLLEAARLRPYWPGAPLMCGHLALDALREMPGSEEATSGAREAEAFYAEAARRYPLAPALRLLVGDARLGQGRTEEAALAYAEAWTLDQTISDLNVCFSSIFRDPRPGCLAQLGGVFEGGPLVEAELAKQELPERTRFGLLIRRILLVARWRMQAQASAPAAALRLEADRVFVRACAELARAAPEDGHAALFYATALQVTAHKK